MNAFQNQGKHLLNPCSYLRKKSIVKVYFSFLNPSQHLYFRPYSASAIFNAIKITESNMKGEAKSCCFTTDRMFIIFRSCTVISFVWTSFKWNIIAKLLHVNPLTQSCELVFSGFISIQRFFVWCFSKIIRQWRNESQQWNMSEQHVE